MSGFQQITRAIDKKGRQLKCVFQRNGRKRVSLLGIWEHVRVIFCCKRQDKR